MDFLKMHLRKKGSFTNRDFSHVVYLGLKAERDRKLAHEWRREQSTPYSEAEKVELNKMIVETTTYLSDLLYSHREGGGLPLTDEQAMDIAMALIEETALVTPFRKDEAPSEEDPSDG